MKGLLILIEGWDQYSGELQEKRKRSTAGIRVFTKSDSRKNIKT